MSLNFAPTSIRRYTKITWKDLVLGLATPLATFWIRDPNFFSEDKLDIVLTYTTISCFWWAVAAITLQTNRSVTRYFSPSEAKQIVVASAAVVAATAVTSFIIWRLDSIPRSLPVLHFFVMAITHTLLRAWSHHRHSRRERRFATSAGKAVERNVIIFGCNRLAWFYIRILDTFSLGNQKVVAIIDERPSYWGRSLAGRIVAGASSQLPALIDEYAVHGVRIDMLVVALMDEQESSRHEPELARLCEASGIILMNLPHVLGLQIPTAEPSFVVSQVNSGETGEFSLSGYWRVKRVLDFVVAAVLLILLLPVFLIVSIATWFDVGTPVFFWQQRIGQNGGPLYVYKFRTLSAPYDRDGNRIPDEKRISGCGHFLRRARLDELPQLWNILNGQMSFIGPRPLMDVDHPEDDELRSRVPPGLTGWAQVVGGRLITSEEKSALDDWYVLNASLWVDLKLTFLTIRFLARGESRDEDAIRRALDERAARTAGGQT